MAKISAMTSASVWSNTMPADVPTSSSIESAMPAAPANAWEALWRKLVHTHKPWLLRVGHLLGFPFLVMTLLLSVRFLVVSHSTLQNDLFWADFNSTSGGIFIASVFNTMLTGRSQGPIQLTAPQFAVFGTLASTKPQIGFPTAYTNILLFHRLNTPEHAITSLRRPELSINVLYKQNQFCWVDFDRRFSLAHTAKREQRCLANETTNGAVYMEAFMRNFGSKFRLDTGQNCFTTSIRNPLNESVQGRAFLEEIDRIWNKTVNFTVDQELAYWRTKNITHFTMQWGNMALPGMTEQIQLVSALGVRTNLAIKTVPTGPGLKTTVKMFWMPANDFWAVDEGNTAISGMSLVRGTSTFYENFNITMEQVMIHDGLLPYPFTPKDRVLREVLGPFGSIDMKHVLFPDSLFDFVINGYAIINEKLLNNLQAQQNYSIIPKNMGFHIFPASWRTPNASTWGFLGGSPLCSSGTSVSYIQLFLSYSEPCSTGSVQETLRESRMMFVLSLVAIGHPGEDQLDAMCASGLLVRKDCIAYAKTASAFINLTIPTQDQQTIRSLALKAHQDILQVNPDLIQFVVNNTNRSHFALLRQPMLASDPSDLWNFFGWLYAMDWAIGNREVIRFEGDEGSLMLLSSGIKSSALDVQGTEIPKTVSVYFVRILQYTTIVSIFCAFLALGYTVANRGHVAGVNLLEFNRVTSAVWIGRPLVLARGIVAVCMISTSKVLLHVHGQMTKFDETPKEWYNVLLTAGESCWFSYVTVDLLVPLTQGYTLVYAALSSVLVQLTNAMIDFAMPFEHRAELDLQCEMLVFYQEVACTSGRVEIGSLWRFLVIASSTIGITLATFLLLRVTTQPTRPIRIGEVLLSSIAKEVFVTDGWIHEGKWYLDKASALLSGLVTLHFTGCSRVLEVKSWTLLYLHNNRLYSFKQEKDHQPSSKENNQHVLAKAEPATGGLKHTHTRTLPTRLSHAIALVPFTDTQPHGLVPRKSSQGPVETRVHPTPSH